MSNASITVRVPLAIRRRPGRKTVVTPGGEMGATVRVRADPALVKALARAFRWQRLLDEGRYGSISEMARAERIERGYLGKVLQLTLLAPRIVEALLDGRADGNLTRSVLRGGMPTLWSEHVELFANPILRFSSVIEGARVEVTNFGKLGSLLL